MVNVFLSKKKIKSQLSFKTIIIALSLVLGLFILTSCKDESSETSNTKQLGIPKNVNIEGNIISWDEVVNSTNYSIHISGYEGSPISTRELSYDLSKLNLVPGETYKIRIQAIGNEVQYQHSDLSSELSYFKPELPLLETP